MATPSRLRLLLLIVLYVYSDRTNGLINRQLLENELKRIGDEALGVAVVQEEYDKNVHQKNPLNGQTIVEQISQELSRKIRNLVDPLTKLREAIENNNFENEATMDSCCQMSSLDFNSIYRTEVNLDKACVAKSSSSTPNRKFPPKSIEDEMKTNRKNNNGIIWQYFGSVDGTFINYPSVKITNCNFDPRFRPFYASGARPKQKDVVIVTDTSNSMNNPHQGTPLLQIAKEAAITVLKTLNPSDRVGVVSFNSDAKTPGQSSNPKACFADQLAMATANNIKEMESFINRLGAERKTNYEKALLAAFNYFQMSSESLQGEARDQMILFLTDGEMTEGRNPLEVIRDENKKLGNRVIVFTFALGNDFSLNSTQLLSDMARQTMNSNLDGQIKIGKFRQINNPSDLKLAMGSYYMDITSSTTNSETVFSSPHIDSFSDIGLISSICQAVYKTGTFTGVVCTDLKISDLLSDITYFQDGELSYAFIIDGLGRTLVHPLLPQPRGIKSDPVLLDIRHFERGQDIPDVINSMKRGESGQRTFISKRILPRGSMVNEGIESRDVKSHYFWSSVPGSNYSVCVVIGEGDKDSELTNLVGNRDYFMYHRRDIVPGGWKSCRHYARFATIDKSSVMLTPSAFEKPYEYLDTPETQALIRDYERYFGGDTNDRLGLKDTVRSTVSLTYRAELFWKSHVADYAIWRYMVTKDGVVRMFPGIQLNKDWDHNRRPWYWRALSQKGLFVLSAPYNDLWGAGYLLTLTQTIFEGSSDRKHNSTDQSMAVMAIDLPIHYFYNRILTLYPDCKSDTYSCFVIDNSGFIVMHRDFVERFTDPNLDESYHIVSKEGTIANDLIAENILTTRICTDFESKRDQLTYRVSFPELKKDGISKLDTCLGYEIRPITNSNLFLIIKKTFTNQLQCCNKNIYSECSPGVSCGCLCYRNILFNYCKNEYISGDASPPCSARFANLESVTLDEKSRVQSLDTCFHLNCPSRSNEEKCYSIAGCSWCTQTSKGNIIDPACCKLSEECPFGKSSNEAQCQTTGPLKVTTPGAPSPSSDKQVLVIAIAVGCSVGVLLIIVILILLLRRRNKSNQGDDKYITAVDAAAIGHGSDGPRGHNVAANVYQGDEMHQVDVIPRSIETTKQ